MTGPVPDTAATVTADLAALPLRDRKRVLTRQSILAAAERLFEERGFDNVTVAEIADAANVSVKTLFVYFRSKEDLVFTDTWLLDLCLDAIRNRPDGTSPGEAITRALVALLRDGKQTVSDGIEGFHRGYGDSAALHSRLLRMWEQYEDAITAVLTAEASGEPDPAARLQAIRLIGILRTLTSPELRIAIADLAPDESLAYVCDWLLAVGRIID
ncbi:MAG TPA: helix-turn-helix domain-containing protein [Streptosporangiaceae bacterium]|nr:helix-turn-helix domain-containing protein [Streptosporangiaceae bacterium]